jgi:hypothetical protein
MKKILSIIGVIILLSAITLSGCDEQKAPVISNFEVIPAVIEVGNSTHLIWNVTEATTVTIDNGIGTVALKGSQSITPLKTTTYTLTAKGSTTITATTTITVGLPAEQFNISMTQNLFFIEITEDNNKYINQSDVNIIATNTDTMENQTSALGPIMNDGDGNPTFLGVGDIITFRNQSEFPVGETWDIQLMYQGVNIGQGVFKNPEGPYNTPIVRMEQTTNTSVRIIAIINGPLNQQLCSIKAINATSQNDQSVRLGATFNDNDNNPNVLMVSDQITFSNLERFKERDRWTIQLVYNDETIGQCSFTKPGNIIIIPP